MKNYLQINKLLFAVLTSLILVSCDNNVEEQITETIVECNPDTSFATQVKPIIDNNCIECHNGNQFPDLRNFEGIRNNASRVRAQVVSRRMPIGGSLSNEEIEIIRCWIDSGALNN